MNPRDLLQLFAAFIGAAPEMVDVFAQEHPELVDPPPEEPASDLDPTVLAEINDGKL